MPRANGQHAFSPEERERALTALALVGGNARRAHDMLKQDSALPRAPSHQVLQLWKHEHADLYREAVERLAPEIERRAINDYRAIVARTNETHLALVERAAARVNDLDGKDAAQAARNLAIAGGVAADKLLVFTDRPNQITERRDPGQILRDIETIVGTVEEDETDRSQMDRSPLSGANERSNPRELPAAS